MRSSLGLAGSFVAIGCAMAMSLLLVTSPVLAIVASPLAFGLMDWGMATALGIPGPRIALRMFGRVVAAAAAGIALRVLLSLAGTPRAPVLAPWLLPAIAILLSLSWSFAALAANLVGATRADEDGARPRPPLGDGALVMLSDFVVAAFAVVLSIVSHDRPPRVGMVSCLALAATMCARGLLVATVAHRCSVRPSSPRRVVLAFVLWLAHASIVTTLARDPIAWSGLGAAVVLTLAAILAEARRGTPSAVSALGRATIAWSISTTLSLLVLIGHS